MSEGSDSVPRLMTSLLGANVPIKCEANLVSYFNPGFSVLWGTKLLLLLQGT
jgi:hypothetical protein